jgi:hypothetical protein
VTSTDAENQVSAENQIDAEGHIDNESRVGSTTTNSKRQRLWNWVQRRTEWFNTLSYYQKTEHPIYDDLESGPKLVSWRSSMRAL